MEKIYEIVQIKQIIKKSQLDAFMVRGPEYLAEISYEYIGEDDREVLLVICLNSKNVVIAVHRAHIGSLNASIVSPREVFKSAILNNTASIAIAHQHPSGNDEMSKEDLNASMRIKESGDILGIPLLDSIIIGEKRNGKINYTSLKEKGYL